MCCDELGVDVIAVQLPCGHAFCQSCLDQWAKNSHNDCPHCRQPYKRSKMRPLKPWNGGLRLKDLSREETAALKALEEVRAERARMESRAAAAERAVRQAQRAILEQPITALHAVSAVTDVNSTAQSSAVAPPACGSRSELTEEQRQRAAANRAAALERKRERDAAAAAAAAEAAAAAAAAEAAAAGGAEALPMGVKAPAPQRSEESTATSAAARPGGQTCTSSAAT